MATIDAHARQLRALFLLRAAPEDAVADLDRLLEWNAFEPGDDVVRPASPIRDVYLVAEGRVCMFHWDPDAREQAVELAEPGDIVALSPARSPRPACSGCR